MKKYLNFGLKAGMVLAFGLSTSAFAADDWPDACKEAGGHTGTAKTTTGQNDASVTGSIGGRYHYEIWYQGGNNSMTYYDDGTFKASWNGTNDFLARVGLKYNETKTHEEIGHITADFKWSHQGSAGGYNYIGIYGWTVDPLVEYYIVDDWFNKPGANLLGDKVGQFEVDGAVYEVWKHMRNNEPSIKGRTTFPQYFSVRSNARNCGHIDISAHFKKWEELGLEMGKMYEAKVLMEAGGGSGSFDVSYLYMTDTGEPPAPPKEIERKPFKKLTIPGTIEAEDFDEGNYGISYSGTQGGSGSDGDPSYRGEDYPTVDVVKSATGRVIGYTTAEEWLEYTVNVLEDGEYDITASVSNGSNSGKLGLSIDGKDLTSLSFKGTKENWDAYEDATGKATLSKGEHVLRVSVLEANTNIDFVKFDLPGYVPPEDSGNGGEGGDIQAIASTLRLNAAGKTFQVFDMQGRLLGRVDVANGASLADALFAKFQKTGVYMVKQGSKFQQVRVTR